MAAVGGAAGALAPPPTVLQPTAPEGQQPSPHPALSWGPQSSHSLPDALASRWWAQRGRTQSPAGALPFAQHCAFPRSAAVRCPQPQGP